MAAEAQRAEGRGGGPITSQFGRRDTPYLEGLNPEQRDAVLRFIARADRARRPRG